MSKTRYTDSFYNKLKVSGALLVDAGLKTMFHWWGNKVNQVQFVDIAINKNDPCIIEALIDREPSSSKYVTMSEHWSGQAIHKAINANNPEILDIILSRLKIDIGNEYKPFFLPDDHFADQNTTYTPVNCSALEYAIKKAENGEIIKVLAKYGAELDDTTVKGHTLLNIAVARNNVEIVKAMLESRADCNYLGENDVAAIAIAVKNDNIAMVKLLDEYGADFDIKDKDGNSLAHYATKVGSIDMLKMFEKLDNDVDLEQTNNDVDLEQTNNDGDSPLHFAVKFNKPDIVKWLLDQEEVDINEQNNDNQTPLHMAIKAGYNNIATLLIQHEDIDLNLGDDNSNNAVHYAIKFDKYDVFLELLEAGASVHSKNNDGNTALHFAVFQNAKYKNALIEKGAKIKKNDDRQTPDDIENFKGTGKFKESENKILHLKDDTVKELKEKLNPEYFKHVKEIAVDLEFASSFLGDSGGKVLYPQEPMFTLDLDEGNKHYDLDNLGSDSDNFFGTI